MDMGKQTLLLPLFDGLQGLSENLRKQKSHHLQHMACGASRQHRGKKEHAMQLNTPAFKKAAKRYAARHGLALNEGQLHFSEFLGFSSTHEALLAFGKSEAPSAAPIEKSQNLALFWCDLTVQEFKVLFECLSIKHWKEIGDSNEIWNDKGRQLIRALIPKLHDRFKNPCTTSALFNWMDLDALDSLRNEARVMADANGLADKTSEWHAANQNFNRYLDGIPGYELRRIGQTRRQDQSVREQHAYSISSLSRVFDLLAAIEACGGAAQCQGQIQPAICGDSMKKRIEKLIAVKAHPSHSDDAREIVKMAEVAEIYRI